MQPCVQVGFLDCGGQVVPFGVSFNRRLVKAAASDVLKKLDQANISDGLKKVLRDQVEVYTRAVEAEVNDER